MFDNLDPNQSNQPKPLTPSPLGANRPLTPPVRPLTATPPAARPSAVPPTPPVEDIFSGVKEAGLPRPKGAPAMNAPVAAPKRSGNGLLKALIVIIIVLILAVVGLVLASKFLGFTGLSQLGIGVEKKEAPAAQTPIKDSAPAVEEEEAPEEEAAAPEIANEEPAAEDNDEETGGLPGMPGAEEEPADVPAPTSTPIAPVGSSTPAIPVAPVVPVDTDADGLTDAEEAALGTSPSNPDSDNDGLTDSQEVKTYLTSPTNPDTDADTYTDGAEVKAGYNPRGAGKLVQ